MNVVNVSIFNTVAAYLQVESIETDKSDIET